MMFPPQSFLKQVSSLLWKLRFLSSLIYFLVGIHLTRIEFVVDIFPTEFFLDQSMTLRDVLCCCFKTKGRKESRREIEEPLVQEQPVKTEVSSSQPPDVSPPTSHTVQHPPAPMDVERESLIEAGQLSDDDESEELMPPQRAITLASMSRPTRVIDMPSPSHVLYPIRDGSEGVKIEEVIEDGRLNDSDADYETEEEFEEASESELDMREFLGLPLNQALSQSAMREIGAGQDALFGHDDDDESVSSVSSEMRIGNEIHSVDERVEKAEDTGSVKEEGAKVEQARIDEVEIKETDLIGEIEQVKSVDEKAVSGEGAQPVVEKAVSGEGAQSVVEKAQPVVEKAVSGEGAQPVVEKAVPVDEKAVPVDKKAQPIDEKAQSVDEKVVSVEEEVVSGGEIKSVDGKADRIEEAEKFETKSAETKSAETKSAETKSAETKFAETKFAETKFAETKSAETKSAEIKSVEEVIESQIEKEEVSSPAKSLEHTPPGSDEDVEEQVDIPIPASSKIDDLTIPVPDQLTAPVMNLMSEEEPVSQSEPLSQSETSGDNTVLLQSVSDAITSESSSSDNRVPPYDNSSTLALVCKYADDLVEIKTIQVLKSRQTQIAALDKNYLNKLGMELDRRTSGDLYKDLVDLLMQHLKESPDNTLSNLSEAKALKAKGLASRLAVEAFLAVQKELEQ
eukprot:Blabericola_migrator_1__13116@NODE_894_length_6157_cov_27_897701_g616_i1_p2_GENE_NODE_894_length_6157_cov_27_897701_g616_i1NODE_894_length_6157_cov_27_897701_g616_i1_p2_ORF_typecomplete_len680_score226_83Shisa/PF13908_6/0_033Shisa/PF13908_6/7_8e03Shisa/PF13908_6/7_5e03Cytochromec551/PF10643_9/4_NODE_894_length_6157_cov_27_897701_g616_i123634402